MYRVLAILLLPLALAGAERWTLFRSGPFEVYTAAGQQAGRRVLNDLEQLRHGLEQVLGKTEMEAVWPIRLVVFDSSRDSRGYQLSDLKQVRDAWVGGIVQGKSIPIRECARVLLEANASRMPVFVEQGLLAVFSTLDIQGTRVTLGAPVEASERDEDWARMHLLTVGPEYGGRARVLFSNFEQGADEFAAYKNAFEKTPAEIDAETKRYLASGAFQIRKLSGTPINPQRDFRPREIDTVIIQVILADLLEGKTAQEAYREVLNRHGASTGALEGLGMFAEAVAAGSKSARCHLEFGRLQDDENKARAAFQQAAELNPRWAEPYYRLAELESNASMKEQHLGKATRLESRNTVYWEALAEVYLEANKFSEAGKAFSGAGRSALTEQERERYWQARREVEMQRIDYLAAERIRKQERRENELQRLREEAMERIREAEERINTDNPQEAAGSVVMAWPEGLEPTEKLQGALERVDCLGAKARLVIQVESKDTIQLIVQDPSQIVILGGGKQTLSCGPQRPQPEVVIEYVKRLDAELATIGEARVIEFR